MKKFFTLALMLLMAFSLVSCGKDDDENPGEQPPVTNPSDTDKLIDDTYKNLISGKKVYLTSIGQSDIDTVQNILLNVENVGVYSESDSEPTEAVKIYVDNVLSAESVAEGSVVLLVTGSSTKGLGAAGTDINAENARATAFANAAKANKFTLVVLHVGGEQRRGTQADPIIKTVVPAAKLVMVVEKGNADGLFTSLAASANAGFYSYTRSSKMVDSFKKLFGLE